MAITTLPTPPSRANSPADFATKADALLSALPDFVTEANALADDVTTKQSTASSAATTATTKAGEASDSAVAAAASNIAAQSAKTSAESAAAAAAASYDAFDDRYLGAKSADPTVDNDGAALQVGALYWNTAINRMKCYSGGEWKFEFADSGDILFQASGTGAVATNVQSKLRSLELVDYAALRAFTGEVSHVQIVAEGIAGLFIFDESDTTSADNGGTVLVDASGRRWKRVYVGEVHVDWFASGDGTNESAKIQAALNAGGKKIVFGGKTFIAENLTVPEGMDVEFRGTTMRFPDTATAYASMFVVGDINATALKGPYKISGRLLISAKKSDNSYQAAGKLLKGVYVVGAKDAAIDGVRSDGLPDGFAVHIAKSYGASPVVPERITVDNVTALESSYGAVAATAVSGLVATNLTAISKAGYVGGAALVLEPDVSAGDIVQDVEADLLIGVNGAGAITCAAHDYTIQDVTINRYACINPASSTMLAAFSHNHSGAVATGKLKNITLLGGRLDGGQYGFYSPNDVFVENLHVEDTHVKNCSGIGFRITASGTFVKSSAKLCATSGLKTASMPNLGVQSGLLTLLACDFDDNNTTSAVNESGIRCETISDLSLIDTSARDTRGTPLQKYGVYFAGTSMTLINSRLSGNAVGRYNLISGTLNDFSSTDTGSYMRLNPLNLALFGAGSFGNGAKVTFIANATTIPTANPTGGGILYVEAGALKYRGSSGTVTTLGPA